MNPIGYESDFGAAAGGAWKTVTIGTYPTVVALRDALVQRDIKIGDLAAQMLRLPSFTLTSARARIDLSVVAVSQLGLGSNGASFARVHAHAAERGLRLCPPELAPQLRLQYLDQKIGEYLVIGMKPLPAASGSDTCFVVGNGGAGLLIIGRSAGPDWTLAPQSRMVFVRWRLQ